MKKHIAILCMFLFIFTPLFSQERRTPAPITTKHVFSIKEPERLANCSIGIMLTAAGTKSLYNATKSHADNNNNNTGNLNKFIPGIIMVLAGTVYIWCQTPQADKPTQPNQSN